MLIIIPMQSYDKQQHFFPGLALKAQFTLFQNDSIAIHFESGCR